MPKLAVYLDENVPFGTASALKQHGFSVTTPKEAGLLGHRDESQLDFASQGEMILITCDRGDFAALHRDWVAHNRRHFGIVICKQKPFKLFLNDLLRFLKEKDPHEMQSQIFWV